MIDIAVIDGIKRKFNRLEPDVGANNEVIVNLIGHTTTDTGLTIQAELDKNTYATGIKVSDEDLKRVNLLPARFDGKDWNYAIKSQLSRK